MIVVKFLHSTKYEVDIFACRQLSARKALDHYSTMFLLDPEGRYRCTNSMATDNALLVLSGTWLNSVNAHLFLGRGYFNTPCFILNKNEKKLNNLKYNCQKSGLYVNFEYR